MDGRCTHTLALTLHSGPLASDHLVTISEITVAI
jgi:hypothetical protein